MGDLDPIRDLGVHEAVRPVSGETGLPRLTGYVERAHVRSTLRTARDDSLMLVVGGLLHREVPRLLRGAARGPAPRSGATTGR